MGNEEINSNATDKSNANDHGGEINSASEGADTSKKPK